MALHKTSIDPFRSSGGPGQVACLDGWMQFAELADHYIQSADALVNAALDDRWLLDVHVQPSCFLYRHGLELLLKDLAWKGHYLATGTKIFAQRNWKALGRHHLVPIWDMAKGDATTVLGSNFPLDSARANDVRSFLVLFDDHDSDSVAFRYPSTTKRGRKHPQLQNVNLAVLRTNVHNAFNEITAIRVMIDSCFPEF